MLFQTLQIEYNLTTIKIYNYDTQLILDVFESFTRSPVNHVRRDRYG